MTTTNTTDRSRRRVFTILGVALGILLVAMGAMLAIGNFATETTQTSQHEAQAVELDLRASGSIEIVANPNTDTITLERTTRDAWGTLTTEESVVDDILIISSSCGVWSNLFIAVCDASYRLEVPTTTEVSGNGQNSPVTIMGLTSSIDITTSNGEIIVEGVEGLLQLHTSNGDVQVTDATSLGDLIQIETDNGSVRLTNVTADGVVAETNNGEIVVSGATGDLQLISSNGRIEIAAANSATIETDTSNGDIVMDLATAPDRVVAETSNGAIEIVVPADARAYAIDASTSNGTADFSAVATDPDSPFTIDARSSNGDISIKRSS